MALAREAAVRAAHPTASEESLHELLDHARAAGRIALDTEFMGEGRYRTLLCLIQLAAPASDPAAPAHVELVDPLREDLDLTPLAQLIDDRHVQIVVHAGRQDMALIRRRLGSEPRSIFDTQVAAGFAGMPAQSSYESLLGGLLGIKLAKSASFTRWDARPLSPEQLLYAREDVVHLLELAAELQRRLRELGRLDWAQQECQPLERSNDERDLDAIFGRLPRIRGLAPARQAVARELLEWRERTAQARNRPVQSVMNDAVLIEIAKRAPTTARQLEQIRGVAHGLVRRPEELLAVVAAGQLRPHAPLRASSPASAPDPVDAPLVALAEALVRARARETSLAYELLASKADLQTIVAARREGAPEPDVRTLQGWRRELVGTELLALLDGAVALSIRDGQVRVER